MEKDNMRICDFDGCTERADKFALAYGMRMGDGLPLRLRFSKTDNQAAPVPDLCAAHRQVVDTVLADAFARAVTKIGHGASACEPEL